MHSNRIVEEAKQLVGTPYRETQRSHDGVDCVGLLLVVAWACGYDFDDFVHYSGYPQGNQLVEEMRKRVTEVHLGDVQVGDILVFWMNRHSKEPQHVGLRSVLRGSPSVVHASNAPSVNRVVEHVLDRKWQKRITHAFRMA